MQEQKKKSERFMREHLAAVCRNDKGLAAIEFALVLPVMLLMLLGTVEVTNLVMAERRATKAASTVADLVARDDSLTEGEITDVFYSARAVFGSMPVTNPQIVITSIEDNAGVTTVAWSRAQNASPDTAGGSVSGLPAGLIAPGGSVLRVRINMPYSLNSLGIGKSYQTSAGSLATSVDYGLANTRTISQTVYIRPRLVSKIPAPTP